MVMPAHNATVPIRDRTLEEVTSEGAPEDNRDRKHVTAVAASRTCESLCAGPDTREGTPEFLGRVLGGHGPWRTISPNVIFAPADKREAEVGSSSR